MQTLARHGLAPGPAVGVTTEPPLADAMQGMMARLRPQGLQGGHHSPELPEGARFPEGHFSCEAGSRRYRTYVPASARSAATGMIVMLHGCTQTPEDFAIGTGMN